MNLLNGLGKFARVKNHHRLIKNIVFQKIVLGPVKYQNFDKQATGVKTTSYQNVHDTVLDFISGS